MSFSCGFRDGKFNIIWWFPIIIQMIIMYTGIYIYIPAGIPRYQWYQQVLIVPGTMVPAAAWYDIVKGVYNSLRIRKKAVQKLDDHIHLVYDRSWNRTCSSCNGVRSYN